MSAFVNTRDGPRVLWNRNNPTTLTSMTNHLPKTNFTGSFEIFNKTLHEICHIPSKRRPWVSLKEHHGIFSSPVTLSYTQDLLPILSLAVYGKCFGDIRVPEGDYYPKYYYE